LGKRTTTFWNKLHGLRHARTESFPKGGVVHHLFLRRLYRRIQKENLRNRREHEFGFIKRRVAVLDFVLLNQDYQYLETAKAVFYTEKALSLNSSRDVAGVHLLQDARGFEVAGDLSTAERRAYYDRAKKILEGRVPLLQGDQITLEGRAFPLAPLRKENDKRLEEAHAKSAKASCK